MTNVNTSASGGPLVPKGVGPVYDDPFDKFLHDIVVGITDLDTNLVRPRWQLKPPKTPEPSVTWCAIGINTTVDQSVKGQTTHAKDNNGRDTVITWERVTVMASMYGPKAWERMGQLGGGLRVPQNREALVRAGVGFVSVGPRRNLSYLSETQVNVRRVDMELEFNRVVGRTYDVYNLLSASGIVYYRSDSGRNSSEQVNTGIVP